MRSRKPWVFARRRLFGWNVRLLTRWLQDGIGTTGQRAVSLRWPLMVLGPELVTGQGLPSIPAAKPNVSHELLHTNFLRYVPEADTVKRAGCLWRTP
jgi:hypothetical protein